MEKFLVKHKLQFMLKMKKRKAMMARMVLTVTSFASGSESGMTAADESEMEELAEDGALVRTTVMTIEPRVQRVLEAANLQNGMEKP